MARRVSLLSILVAGGLQDLGPVFFCSSLQLILKWLNFASGISGYILGC